MVEIGGNSGNLSRVKVLQVVSLTVLLGRAALIQGFFGIANLPSFSLLEKRQGWRLRYKNDGSSRSSIGTNATESESLPVVGLTQGLFGGGELPKQCHKVAPNGAKITMVGSGPGSPDLLTVAAHRVLTSSKSGAANANAKETLIIADRLVSKDILDICIGEIRIAKKYPGCAEQAQEDIYSWVQEGVQQGRHVIRLKIGDPFVFGRGGEEVLRFRDMCGIEPTVIPGVSAALSAPLLGGIPITHRGVSNQVVICTGYGKNGTEPDLIKYHPEQTVVFLMAVGRLRQLTDSLCSTAGFPRDTPVGVVERAGCGVKQRTVIGDMTTISDLAEQYDIQAPSTIIVGNVVRVLLSNDRQNMETFHGLLPPITLNGFEIMS
mmetsp:Transcript_18885/g.26810  ORF Transcript_18885/g.26810 Transcript_18885/m.26810 type:complete len:377 (+) Transcript_18885:142-1272(+)